MLHQTWVSKLLWKSGNVVAHLRLFQMSKVSRGAVRWIHFPIQFSRDTLRARWNLLASPCVSFSTRPIDYRYRIPLESFSYLHQDQMSQSDVFVTATDQLLTSYERAFLGDCLDTLFEGSPSRWLSQEESIWCGNQYISPRTGTVIWLWFLACSVLIASFDELGDEREKFLLWKLGWRRRWGDNRGASLKGNPALPHLWATGFPRCRVHPST